jgi:hypothetical protein
MEKRLGRRKSTASTRRRRYEKWITIKAPSRSWAIAAVIASNDKAFARTVNVKGSEAGTFVPSNFSYNGDAGLTTYASRDNIGGRFIGQDLEQYVGCQKPLQHCFRRMYLRILTGT